MCLHFRKGLIFFPYYAPFFSAAHCGIRSHYSSKGFSGRHRCPNMAIHTTCHDLFLCGVHGTPLGFCWVEDFVS